MYTGKFINIRVLNSNKEIYGECLAVDPVTNTIVLVTKESNKPMSVKFIMSHAIESITIEVGEVDIKTCEEYLTFKDSLKREVFQSNFEISNNETLLSRRKTLQNWLEKNRLDVLLNGDVLSVVNGIASIEPPYTVESCRSTNTIILDRIMKFIQSCPDVNT